MTSTDSYQPQSIIGGAQSTEPQLASHASSASPSSSSPHRTSHPSQLYDLLIIEGGLWGCLAAARINKLYPSWRIAIIHEGYRLSGRHSAPQTPAHLATQEPALQGPPPQLPPAEPSTYPKDHTWGWGLHGLPKALTYEIQSVFPHHSISPRLLMNMGYLRRSYLHQFNTKDLISPAVIAHFEGRNTAAKLSRQLNLWLSDIEALSNPQRQEYLAKKSARQQMITGWSDTYPELFAHFASARAGSFATTVARTLGLVIDNFLSPGTELIVWAQRLRELMGGVMMAPWDQILNSWLKNLHSSSMLQQAPGPSVTPRNTPLGAIDVYTGISPGNAISSSTPYSIETSRGTLKGHRLLFTPSLWQIPQWLDLSLAPPPTARAISQRSFLGQPNSLICLSALASSENDENIVKKIPQITWLAREHTQVTRDHGTVIFQGIIAYESTLRAPRSVQMVKKLRRALKELNEYLGISLQEQYLTVLPHAYPAVNTPWKEPLPRSSSSSTSSTPAPSVYFCGDSYGPSLTPTACGLESLNKVLSQLTHHRPETSSPQMTEPSAHRF